MRQLAGVAVVAAMLLSALGLSMSDHSILKADIVARVKHAAPTRLWVEFRDKGCVDHSDISFLRSLLDTLHPEAKKRREIHMKAHLRLHSSVPLDYHDVPVCPDYIRAVETIEGVRRIRVVSALLNSVSLELKENCDAHQVMRALQSLPAVTKVSAVRHGYHRTACQEEGGDISQHQKRDEDDDGSGTGHDAFDYGDSRPQLAAMTVIPLHERGINGSGVRVAQLDAGWNIHHDAFQHLTIAQFDVIHDDDDVSGTEAHGTATLSCLAGQASGELRGVAPGVSLVLLAKTEDSEDEYEREEDFFILGMEQAEMGGIQLVSASLGYTAWWTFEDTDGKHSQCSLAVDRLAQRGLIVLVANGNGGRHNAALDVPADSEWAISVGAIDHRNASITAFSTRGPSYDGRIKPELCAPGASIYGADERGGYGRHSGTSFSTPFTAGCVALMLQANPILGPLDVKAILTRSSSMNESPTVECGWGNLNCSRAVELSSHWQAVKAETIDQDDFASVCATAEDCTCPGSLYGPFCENTKLECEEYCESAAYCAMDSSGAGTKDCRCDNAWEGKTCTREERICLRRLEHEYPLEFRGNPALAYDILNICPSRGPVDNISATQMYYGDSTGAEQFCESFGTDDGFLDFDMTNTEDCFEPRPPCTYDDTYATVKDNGDGIVLRRPGHDFCVSMFPTIPVFEPSEVVCDAGSYVQSGECVTCPKGSVSQGGSVDIFQWASFPDSQSRFGQFLQLWTSTRCERKLLVGPHKTKGNLVYLKVMTTEWTQYPQIGCGWTADGRYATSGEIGHDTRSILVFDVSLVKNGSFTIDFEVDGEDHYDVFFVTVDGEKVMQHATDEIASFSHNLTKGYHQIELVYEKDSGVSEGEDKAFLYRLTVTGIDFADDSCTFCVPGEYMNTDGGSACKICPEDQYSNSFGSSVCRRCQPGYYAEPGSSDCTEKHACTLNDMDVSYTPCRGGTQVKHWTFKLPQKCNPTNANSVVLPNPENIACGCPFGTHPVHHQCVACPSQHQQYWDESMQSCRSCDDDLIPRHGLLLSDLSSGSPARTCNLRACIPGEGWLEDYEGEATCMRMVAVERDNSDGWHSNTASVVFTVNMDPALDSALVKYSVAMNCSSRCMLSVFVNDVLHHRFTTGSDMEVVNEEHLKLNLLETVSALTFRTDQVEGAHLNSIRVCDVTAIGVEAGPVVDCFDPASAEE